ncbi:gamma-glutamyltranspeptidase / glutathione hydrolase [Paenibacillus sp. UNCCL117]|uniref:gamma-glutamyltransferase family protein n=1 Tax=unclassified Paenibacillus TaxID=185978 RepID=UPI000891232A|nr:MULTISPECIES: gamma-glutamyltransferase [unclassified Paenibacillus]SDD79272.1 gamma-glutamyltranspeptidase / glutathione hydrolase [Paenibacillus sp. cl123]SFW53156.1 gamma-glutamyltranspeptidase / glutathione hydrolase [Paenibacillus sp. UNCCL117]
MTTSRGYAVSSAHPLATRVGMEVLEAGGNAVDAAVAVSYALGVVEFYASGIGGGGVMLICPPDSRPPVVCDYRETAPMSGHISPEETGVPGFVRGMEQISASYGTKPLAELIAPAIRLAEEGFIAGEALERQVRQAVHLNAERFPGLFPGGEPIRSGTLFRQPELAATMRSIQQSGSRWFYEGEFAQSFAASVDGMDAEDLRGYQAAFKEPLYNRYGDYEIVSSPPPFGGMTLIQALRVGEAVGAPDYPALSAESIHLWAAAIAGCYELRKSTMGDPGFYQADTEKWTGDACIAQLAAAVRSDGLAQTAAGWDDVANTTHFTILDSAGLCVSTTNTIGGFFGPGLSVGGFFLNNQLRNFTSDTDVQSPNKPEPGKRPQSYVCPTVLRSERQLIAIGSAGGKRIPLVLALVLSSMVKHGLDLAHAVAAPRFFADQQTIQVEQPLPADTRQTLEAMGYEVIDHPEPFFYGGIQGLTQCRLTGAVAAAADPRRGGLAQTGTALV